MVLTVSVTEGFVEPVFICGDEDIEDIDFFFHGRPQRSVVRPVLGEGARLLLSYCGESKNRENRGLPKV